MNELDNLLGSTISLISQNDIRYEGVLFSINAQESSIILRDVRCLGTEDRLASRTISPNPQVLPFVSFPHAEIKDLYVRKTLPPEPEGLSTESAVSETVNTPHVPPPVMMPQVVSSKPAQPPRTSVPAILQQVSRGERAPGRDLGRGRAQTGGDETGSNPRPGSRPPHTRQAPRASQPSSTAGTGEHVNQAGRTAIIFAAMRGQTDIVRLLLDRGADTNVKSNNGDTALSLADKRGHSSTASLLRSRANDEEAAQRSRDEAAQRSREEAAALKCQADRLYSSGKYSEAAAKYFEALNSDPHDANLYSAKGACHISLSQWEEALRDAVSALDKDPSLVQGYHVKAVALQHLGRVDDALGAVQGGLAFDRDNEDLRKLRMVLGKEMLPRLVEEAEQALVSGRMSALRTIEEGLRIDPEHPILRRLLTELDFSTKDDDGNTPLLFAVENNLFEVLLNIYPLSPWHSVNKSKQAFLDVALKTKKLSSLERLGSEIESSARTALSAADSDPSHSWAAIKHFNGATCPPMDALMDMIGLRAVKRQAIGIFQSVRQDLGRRSAKARITSSQAMNFLFLGNPDKDNISLGS